jgi:hypothetical protein
VQDSLGKVAPACPCLEDVVSFLLRVACMMPSLHLTHSPVPATGVRSAVVTLVRSGVVSWDAVEARVRFLQSRGVPWASGLTLVQQLQVRA